MGKLRKLQGVLRDNGAMKVSLEELLPGGGKSLQARAGAMGAAGRGGAAGRAGGLAPTHRQRAEPASFPQSVTHWGLALRAAAVALAPQELLVEDAARVSELEAAHAACRAAAIDALLGRPRGTTAARAAASGSGGGGALPGDAAASEPRAGGGAEAADEFAGVERGAGAAKRRGKGGRAVAATVTASAVEGEEPEGPGEEPLWKRQLRQAAKDTFHRVRGPPGGGSGI
jgi:hypothetical protein